jgi:eukaryotic-like serine/threonine-protein kinase
MGVASPSTVGSASLSPELEAAAARRLGALVLMVAVASAIMGPLETLTGPPSPISVQVRLGLVGLVVAAALALYVAIATEAVSPARALTLGLMYEFGHALLVAPVFHATTLGSGVEARGWTPIAVWTLLYPLIVPTPHRRVVIATVATAATDPLGLWINAVVGGRPLSWSAVHILMPTAMACVLAPIVARIVYGLTVEVKRAREMGSYRLVERLGQGGMGEVWRAEHRMLARPAAIKLIRPSSLGATGSSQAHELVKRFEREAQATAALRSPHTIAVYDYGVADGTFHYVMELLEGFSLQALVDRFGPVPPERVVSLLRQACHSLAEAHTAGLVHRDIKPANLFVCRLGGDVDFVKVLDFGLVKVQGPRANGAEALTVEGGFTGTPAFIPPEVALGVETVDGRADLYALGCVGYWLLTGRRVFESSNAMQMVVDHVRTPAVPPSQRAPQPIPEGLERVILRCLEKDPARRPGSAVELSRELQALQLEGLWTEVRARSWWAEHRPAAAEGPATVDLHPSRDTTRSSWGGAVAGSAAPVAL